jgi:hypothetical protein
MNFSGEVTNFIINEKDDKIVSARSDTNITNEAKISRHLSLS